jgi:hypothetical protein
MKTLQDILKQRDLFALFQPIIDFSSGTVGLCVAHHSCLESISQVENIEVPFILSSSSRHRSAT